MGILYGRAGRLTAKKRRVPARAVAEWHRRAPAEPRFEVGTVVGISGDGLLSRNTTHAAMVAVVSRQAAVEGSCPGPGEDRAAFDSIAYVGRVPVAVRGRWRAGDRITPSGRNDGTAAAVAGADAGRGAAGPLLGVIIEAS